MFSTWKGKERTGNIMGMKIRVHSKNEEQYYLNLAAKSCNKGQEDAIRIFIEIWNCVSKERLIPLLSEKFKMSEIQSMSYIEEYWGNKVIKVKEETEKVSTEKEE